VRVDECVSAVRAGGAGGGRRAVLVCFCYRWSEVSEVGGALSYVRLVLKVVNQNDGDFVDVMLLQSPNIQTRAGCHK